MACPFFMPVARIDRGDWIHAPRLPLGDPYRGVCHAIEAELFEPAETDLRELCNCGYARGRCSRMPLDSPDAVRFSVIDETGGCVSITWVIEKDHAPVEFGKLEYREGQLSEASPLLTAQALAFVKGYVAELGAKAAGATNAHE